MMTEQFDAVRWLRHQFEKYAENELSQCADQLDAARKRIEQLRGALKTASGRFYELGDTQSANDCLEWAGDKERK